MCLKAPSKSTPPTTTKRVSESTTFAIRNSCRKLRHSRKLQLVGGLTHNMPSVCNHNVYFGSGKNASTHTCVWTLFYAYTGRYSEMGYWPNSADFLKRVLKYLVRISVRLPAIMADYCRGFPQYRQATARIFLSNRLRPFKILNTINIQGETHLDQNYNT